MTTLLQNHRHSSFHHHRHPPFCVYVSFPHQHTSPLIYDTKQSVHQVFDEKRMIKMSSTQGNHTSGMPHFHLLLLRGRFIFLSYHPIIHTNCSKIHLNLLLLGQIIHINVFICFLFSVSVIIRESFSWHMFC